ncbi:20761_t:CDS:1, partial [Racocetra persica]
VPMYSNEYCQLVSELHSVEEVSQRARHSIAMLEWSVLNYEILLKSGWNGQRKFYTISTPRIEFKYVSQIFARHPNNQVRSMATALSSLKTKGRIHSSETSLTVLMRWLFRSKTECYYDIDELTAVSVILAVSLYQSTPCRGFGSVSSESHVKIELWSKIFSAVFALHNSKFHPTWELQHLISGNAGRGSSRSDFAAVVNNQDGLQFTFFLVEFEKNGFEIHKDNVVIIAEAVYELNRILSLIHYPTEEEVNKICLHMGLVNRTNIHLNTLAPVYNQKDAT